jgi:hypothetical protein
MTNNLPQVLDGRWIDTHAPEEGRLVRAQALYGFGLYELPFPVELRNDAWLNAETKEKLDCFVAGWLPWEQTGDG